jgi:hypothetical protein
VDSLRFQANSIIPGTSGYALSVFPTGEVLPNPDVAMVTLDVSSSVTIGDSLSVPYIFADGITVSGKICTTDLTVTGFFQAPPEIHVPATADTYRGNYVIVGCSDLCWVPEANLDVSGSALFRGGLLSDGEIDTASFHTNTLIMGESGVTETSLSFLGPSGETTANIEVSNTRLLLMNGITNTYFSFTDQDGVSLLDILPNQEQILVNGTATLFVNSLQGNPSAPSPIITLNTYTDAAAGLHVGAAGLSVAGPLYAAGGISNPTTTQPLLISDNLNVAGDVTVAGGITTSGAISVGGLLKAPAGATMKSLYVSNNLTVAGEVYVRRIRDQAGPNSALGVGPNLSINLNAGPTGTGTLYAGAVTFPPASQGLISSKNGTLLIDLDTNAPSNTGLKLLGAESNYITLIPCGTDGQSYLTYGNDNTLVINSQVGGLGGIAVDNTGDVVIDGELTVNAPVSISNGLDVLGAVQIGGAVSSFYVGDPINVTSKLNVSQLLTVGGGIGGSLATTESVTVGGAGFTGYYLRLGNTLVRWLNTGGATVSSATPTVDWAGPNFATTGYIAFGAAVNGTDTYPVSISTSAVDSCQINAGVTGSALQIGFLGTCASL